jgi:hypothetical protein
MGQVALFFTSFHFFSLPPLPQPLMVPGHVHIDGSKPAGRNTNKRATSMLAWLGHV